MDPPRMKFLLRGKTGVELLLGPTESSLETIAAGECFGQGQGQAADACQFSRDGKFLVLVSRESGFIVRDIDSESIFCQVEHEGIQALAISPCATHAVTWEKYDKEGEGNLIIWSLSSGEIVSRFVQKIYSKRLWPPIQWTDDEALCARITPNQIHIFNGKNIETGGIISRISQPGVISIAVAPGPAPYRISVFVPEKSSKPASVRIFQFPLVDTPIASKSFFKAQEVDMKWSPDGSSMVIHTSTDVDTSGKSYYGETGLYFLQSDGEYDCIIPLTKEGPIHDVSWGPMKDSGFIVLAGSMPCNATLYDNRARPVFEFGSSPRNTISWSPHGRFICIAGFGNLRGDMCFWDRFKLKKMGSTNSNAATSYSWSPDGRYFSTATTFPRLRVDNGFKIFKYNGVGPVIQQARPEIYDMIWRPAAKGVFPDRPQSPRNAQATPSRLEPAVKKPQAYRPPGATGNLAAMMRREEGGSRKLDRNAYTPSSSARRIPGMPPAVEAAASKSKKKKNRETDQATKEAILLATAAALGESSVISAIPPAPVTLVTAAEKQKKLKNLNKKLKQIQLLKEKKQAGDELNEDQSLKLLGEKSIMSQINELS